MERTEWETKLNNLHTRPQGISSEHQINYPELLSLVKVGLNAKVLDIGCGTCWLKYLLPNRIYLGIDAHPLSEDVYKEEIETCELPDQCVDTSFVFAALDGMRDLTQAIHHIKRVTKENIVILTGVNIPPDQYHTHEITVEFIDSQMSGFKKTVEKYVHEKIVFLEYTRCE